MSPPSRPTIRHCPICGIAMQASKSHEEAPAFDRFDCLTCETTIETTLPSLPGEDEPA